MKSLAQLRRPSAKTGPARTAVARVQTKARPGVLGPGNHRRQRRDALERQADEIAARIVRGETNLARRITPAPAAGFQLPASPGAPLASSLRRDLETAFGADLGAVRIHADGTADAATHQQRAEAFTSGRDIFFRANHYAPATSAGRELLAHEVAHVLQQTGRRDAAGRLAATAATGGGAIQCVAVRTGTRLFPESITLAALVAAHRAAAPATLQPAFTALAATLRTIVGDTLGADNAGAAELVRRVMVAHEWDGAAVPDEHRAVVCDVLKATQQPDAAAYLLRLNPALPTLGHQPAVLEAAVAAQPVEWENAQLRRGPLRSYFPWQFVDTFRRILFGSTRDVQALSAPGDDLGDFRQRAVALQTTGTSATGLVENELFHSALQALVVADTVRVSLTRTLFDNVGANLPERARASLRLDLARGVEEAFNLLRTLSPVDAINRMFLHVADDVLALAARAVAVWRGGLSAVAAGDVRDAAVNQRWLTAAQRAEWQPLRTGLLEFGQQIFVRPGSGLPPRGAYRTRLSRTKARARTLFYNEVEARLIRLARVHAGATFDESLALACATLQVLLPGFIAQLDDYRYRDDLGASAGDDFRILHRIHVAEWFARFAQETGWPEFATLARPVLTATESATMDNQVAIIADWIPDTGARITDLANSDRGFAPNRPLGGMGLLTASHLMRVFLIEWYQHVTRTLDTRLQTEEHDFSADRGLILERIETQLDTFRKPHRYSIPADGYAIAHSGPTASSGGTPGTTPPRTSVYDLVADHPRSRQVLAAEDAQIGTVDPMRGFALWPVAPPPRGAPLYFWILPPLTPLVRHLQAIPGLNALVLADIDALRAGGATDTPATPEWMDWIGALNRIGDARLREFSGPLSTSLETGTTTGYDTAMGRLRRATVHDRKILTQFRVRPRLAAYDRHDIRSYANPNQALTLIQHFISAIQPDAERDPHLTLILLDLLRVPGEGETDLQPIFAGMQRFDLIVTWQAMFRVAVRQATEYPAGLLPLMTATERADPAWVQAAVARMQAVIAAMEEVKRTVQLRSGFIALRARSAEEPAQLASTSSSEHIFLNQDFTIDGVNWRILEVFENFEFHPDYGAPGTGSYSPSLLAVNGVDVPAAARSGRQPASTRRLLRVIRNGRVLVVHENDDATLEELSNAVGMQAIVISLQNLEALIERSTELLLEGAEFVPGAGQAVMAARLAASIISFIASDEFEEIKESVFQDPLAIFDPLREVISGGLFTPDEIVEWLLLSGGMAGLTSRLSGVAASRSRTRRPPRPRTRTRSGTIARFAAVVGRVWQVGAGLGRSLGRARGRARRALLGVETFVLERPVLVLAFRFAGDHLDMLEHYARELHGLMAGDEQVDFTRQLSGLGDQLGEIIDAVNQLEIPEEIVPLDTVLELIINLILDRLGAKYRTAGRAILFALDALGLKQDLLRAITQQVPDVMNPNYHWRNFVRTDLQPRFDEFRTSTIQAFSDVLTRLNLPGINAGQIVDVTLTPHGTEFPESEALLDEDIAPGAGGEAPVAPQGGRPLAAPLRRDVEHHFGHDFGHVRLHTGGDAAAVTGRFGAEGLATGSHVYLQPGLAPERGRGAHVLRHELTHVLQQAGPRPLGRPHPATPRVGRPARGLVVQPAHESEAEAIARAAAPSGSPVGVSPAPAPGLQPALGTGTIARIMRRLSRGEGMLEYYHREESRTRTAVAALPDTLAREVAQVGAQIWTLMTGGTAPTLQIEEPFARVRTQIGTYFRGQHSRADLQTIVTRLATESLVQLRAPAGTAPAPGGGAAAPVFDLNVRAFRTAIEGQMLELGFGVRIEFKGAEADAPGGRRRFRINGSDPLQRLKVLFLFMPMIGGTSTLWDELIQQTFSAAPGSPEKSRLQPRVRAWLAERGVVPGLWDRRAFKLSIFARNAILEFLRTGTPLLPSELPSRSDYLSHTPTQGRAFATVGHVGLHVGTYGDPAQSGATKGRERESHHTTQFLLLEYFRNWKEADKRPFRHALNLYPGLTAPGGHPAEFRNTSGTRIDIAVLTGTTESARGPGMPAISLAAITHAPSIHTQGQKDDLLTSIRPAQGYAVQNQFRSSIASPDVRDALFAATDAPLRALVLPPANPRRHAVQNEIFTAMQSTYRWMRQEMFDRLRPGLDLVETAYYNELSRQPGGPGDQIHASDMGAVVTHALTNNNTVMSSAGWTG